MKYTGHYCKLTEYDVDHEIIQECENLDDIIKGIDCDGEKENRKAILKAMAQTILDAI